ncbi:GGDEF domain-containing protein [Silvibacterium dinghuense]|nr:GGDEF domain-containing protein [Silvibacterium dinghuense]
MNAIPSQFSLIAAHSLSLVLMLLDPHLSRFAAGTSALGGALLASLLWGAIYRFCMHGPAQPLRQSIEEETARQHCQALLERERSLILEAIGQTLPLKQLLESIADFISGHRHQLRCWCITARGITAPSATAMELEYPGAEIPQFRHEIYTQDKEWLGFFLLEGTWSAQDDTVLEIGTALAALAIRNRQMHEDLVRRSEHDALTDLPNRILLEQRVAQAMATAERHAQGFALIYIDLDHFKKINDRYGHRTGDAYLQTVARRLSERLRRRDTLARVGGDEFLALITQVNDRSEVEEVVHRFAGCFDAPFPIYDHLLVGTASLGIAFFPEDGRTFQELEMAADAAMYASKRMAGSRNQGAQEAPLDLLPLHPQPPVPSSTIDA